VGLGELVQPWPAALGPLINERQLANVDRIVTETVAAGVRAGGTHEQLYYRPTVLWVTAQPQAHGFPF
jgi:acyl-CoA reductase-like NAD-dependent aldehyde dehydrogenase